MKCRECGANLLETDTYCGKCGAKVKMNVCPECGEILRPGMRFCANCGYEVVGIEEITKERETEDIPVTGGLSTIEIPFDLIEQNIIRDVQKQLDVDIPVETPSPSKSTVNDSYVSYGDDYSTEYEDGYSDEYEEDYAQDNNEYPKEYNDRYAEDKYEDDYYEDYVEDEYYEGDEPPSVISRLLTALMILIGIVVLIILASWYFNTHDKPSKDNNSEQIEETEESKEDEKLQDEEDNSPKVIGTIEISHQAVNIRSYPDKNNSEIIGMATMGETYEYYGFAEENNNWIYIKVDENTNGYISKNYVTIKE